MSDQINDIIEELDDLREDSSVPKNVKLKLNEITSALKENQEESIRINKALNILDEISDDNNIQSYTRTQIWNIASMLESI
jgi:uncharacterized protein (UPF0147 family)